MYLKFEKSDDKLIVHMIGELDHHSAEEVRNKIDDRLNQDKITKLILDFKNVSFMDSSGIGLIMGRYKNCKMKKGSICISRATDSIKRVFELSGIFKIIKIYDTIEEAVQSI